MNSPELMEITIKIVVILLVVTTMALAPSISFSQPTKAEQIRIGVPIKVSPQNG